MVRRTEIEIVNKLKEIFYYENGQLNWKCHMKNFGKKVGYANKDGYIEISISFGIKDSLKLLAHRAIFAINHEYFPKLVDHIDQNPRNNLLENLRDADKFLNAINTGIPSNNSTGVKGVSLYKNGKYTAQIQKNKKKIHLGYYKTIEEAKEARINAEKIHWL